MPARTPTDAVPNEELTPDMLSNEESVVSGPHARLLPPPDLTDDESSTELSYPESSYTGGWFIWILTFSAGISGLLFGYEYADPTICTNND